MMMNKRFWKPSLTTQFAICPIPFHLDTYRGCIYDCRYCFARDFTMFSRRNSIHKSFQYLEANNAVTFEKWMEKTLHTEYDYNKGEEVAIKERIPLKIGATSDPFPPIEKTEKVTFDFLKVLHKHDYPVEIQTKNPTPLAEYIKDFDNPNWCIAVTIITVDQKFSDVCEPNAPKPQDRLKAIRQLVDNKLPVIVKVQPAIYPKIMDDLPDLIKAISECGCWAFNIEGLKVRIAMPKAEQAIFKEISNYLDFDLREYYKREERTGSDWELKKTKKMQYIQLALKLAKQYNLKCLVADNNMGCVGNGSECCGTEKLRNYKIFANNLRTLSFSPVSYGSTEIGKCKVNFCRSQKFVDKTIDEAMEEIKKPQKQTRLMPLRFVRTEEAKKVRSKSMKRGRDYTPFGSKYRELIPSKEDTAGCVTCALNKDSLILVENMRCQQVNDDGGKQANRVYSPEGISPTVPTACGGHHIPKITILAESSSGRGKNCAEYRESRIKVGEANALQTGGGQSTRNYALIEKGIRRLTPKECERLQGFPDGWTEGLSDTQRYKTLGNAVTVNVIEFLGKKIAEVFSV